jgi:HSP20 family protein
MRSQSAVAVKESEEEGKRPLRPFDWFEDLGSEMARRWQELPLHLPTFGRLEAIPWRPSIDMFDRGDRLVIKADLPGMKRDDIELRVDGRGLMISGERQREEEVKEKDYYRMERSFGSFSRHIRLPFEVKASDVQAKLEDSVLEVEIHKPAEVKPAGETIKIR